MWAEEVVVAGSIAVSVAGGAGVQGTVRHQRYAQPQLKRRNMQNWSRKGRLAKQAYNGGKENPS